MGRPLGSKNDKAQKRITDTLRRVVTQNPKKLRAACEKLLDRAVNGDLKAFQFIADRIDGRVPTMPRILFDDSATPPLIIEREIVYSDKERKIDGRRRLARHLASVIACAADNAANDTKASIEGKCETDNLFVVPRAIAGPQLTATAGGQSKKRCLE